jgi:uncharacterized protein
MSTEFMDRTNELLAGAKALYPNNEPGHDFSHITRVLSACQLLSKNQNVNCAVLYAAAILHDVVSVPKNSAERKKASELSAAKAEEILKKYNYSDSEVAQIATAIKEHSFSAGHQPTSLESALLQDADRLDALGAIGIMRTVSVGAQYGTRYYSETEPLPLSRELDDKTYTIDHFYRKLFKLPALMNTTAGRSEADRRVAFMRVFLEQLESEIAAPNLLVP